MLTCRVTILFHRLGCPNPFPTDILRIADPLPVPSADEVIDLAAKTCIYEIPTTLRSSVHLLVREGPPTAPRARIFVPIMMRPWVLQKCHADASCHLGVARTLRMIERFFWWIGLEPCVRWWIRRCMTCQARKTSRHTVRWPVIKMPLPNGPGEVVSVDFFGPLPITAQGNQHILLFTDRFSRRAVMHPTTAAEFTAAGVAHVLVDKYIPTWGCPRKLLSDNGKQFCSELTREVCRLLGVKKLATSSFHAMCNGGTERVNHTLAQMLSSVVNDQQNDWDVHLPHIEFAYNNSVSAATGLAPNEIHIGHLPRFPIAILEHSTLAGNQSLDRDQLAYCDLVKDRQRRAYQLVREHDAIMFSRLARSNAKLLDTFHKRPRYTIGDWVWVYNPEATLRQGYSRRVNDSPLMSKLSLNWTGPFKVLRVGPSPSAPDGRPVGDKLLFLDLPSSNRGSESKPRVSVMRCKPCTNPHDDRDRPVHLPSGLTSYVLTQFASKSPPFHATAMDVECDDRMELVDLDTISAHRFVRGRGGKLAVMYKTRWKGFTRSSWEREADLAHFRPAILQYWATCPDQHGASNNKYLRMRVHAALRELERERGKRFITSGYQLVPPAVYKTVFASSPQRLKGAYFWFKANDGLWWLGLIHTVGSNGAAHVVRFLDAAGPVRLRLQDEFYSIDPDAPRFSWCLQRHRSQSVSRGVHHNADDSRECNVSDAEDDTIE